jgi:putative ABC transport system ATP-binding protein
MRDIPEAAKADSVKLNKASDGARAAGTAPQRPAIDVIGLSKRVADASGELTILHDVDFTVGAAETLALVGASGSGKSTLLGLLAGLDTPSGGKVLLDGVDIFALDEDGRAAFRKAKLGFVFQSFQLLAHLNAVENVMLPLELRGDPAARAKAEAMLGRVGLGSRLRHYPKYLSGGEQQRVALARAFVTEPPLLFADEPTGSLDAATGEAVIGLMFELNRERGSTLVLVTHDPAMAARCGRTLTIAAGRLQV